MAISSSPLGEVKRIAGSIEDEILPSPCNLHSYLSAPVALARTDMVLPGSTVISGPSGTIMGASGTDSSGVDVAVGGGVGVGVGSDVAVGGGVGVGSEADLQLTKPTAKSKTKTTIHCCTAILFSIFSHEDVLSHPFPLGHKICSQSLEGHSASCDV